MIKNKIDAMLFDFDGTLADTSQDMVNCLNILLKKKSQVSANITEAKNFISKGAGGLIDFSMPNLDKEERNIYIKEYLKIYENNFFVKTHLFHGVTDIIELLVSKNYKWGIVTNKPGFLVNPIIKKLDFKYPPDCVVAGDTLSVKKPNPEPLLHASKMISCSPSACVYIGDDMRDIEAAKAANMFSIAASYGSIKNKNTIKEWGSDLMINSPLDLKKHIL